MYICKLGIHAFIRLLIVSKMQNIMKTDLLYTGCGVAALYYYYMIIVHYKYHNQQQLPLS